MFSSRPSGGGGGGGGGGGRRQYPIPAPPQQQPGHRGGSIDSSRGGSRGGSIDSSRGGSRGGSIDRSRGGGSIDTSVSNSRSSRTAIQAKPSMAQPVTRPTPMGRQATGAALFPAAVEVAPPMPTDTTAAPRPPPPSYSSEPATAPAPVSGSSLPAAPPSARGVPVTVAVNEPEAYLFTDDYPFTSKQFDREREELLVRVLECSCLDSSPACEGVGTGNYVVCRLRLSLVFVSWLTPEAGCALTQ